MKIISDKVLSCLGPYMVGHRLGLLVFPMLPWLVLGIVYPIGRRPRQ